MHQAGGGPHATAFVEMIDDLLGFGLRELGMEQGGTAALGELFTAGTAASQPDAVTAIDLAHCEIVLAGATKALACRIDTRESVQVGSLHGSLLQNSLWLSLRTSYDPTPPVNPLR